MSGDPNSPEFKTDCWLDFKIEADIRLQDNSPKDTFIAGYDRGFREAVKLQIAKEKAAKRERFA